MSDLCLGVSWTPTEQVYIPDKGVSFPPHTEIKKDIGSSLCKKKWEDQEFELQHTQGKLRCSLKTKLHHPYLCYTFKKQNDDWARVGEYKAMLSNKKKPI